MNLKSVSSLKPVIYLAEVRDELGKVIWPNRRETVKMTAIVIAVSVAIGAFVGGLDFVFTKLTELFVK